ncbi:hypothetical protein HA402_011896 [Bradysia odoriphaga]|nr:hypothetical protein HA402_011896 [Bradysia odoriphaga]
MVRRAAKKASSSKLTETSSSSKATTTTSSTSKSTVEKSGSQISISSGVCIADVTDLNKSDSQVSFGNVSTQYVVTAPENQPTPPKERIIFGGTQIVEVSSSTDQRDQHAIDGKNNMKNIVSDGNVQTFETMESSSSQKQSSFSTSSEFKSTTDADGKVNTTSREWGTSKNKATSDYLTSKSGTNIEPEIFQSQSHQAEKIKYDTGNNGDNPLYEATSIDSQRKLQQIGNTAPVGHSSDHVKRVKYDDKSKKYITSEESKDSNVIDSITLQMVTIPEDNSSAINVVQDLSRNSTNVGSSSAVSNSTNLTKQSGTSIASTSSNIISSKQSKTSSSTVMTSDATVTSGSTVASNIKNSSDQSKTTNDQNVSDTTTTYTSKVYDDKTKTWNILNESTISEKDVVVKDGKTQRDTGNKVIVSSSTNENLNRSKSVASSQSSKELISKSSNKTEQMTTSSSTSSTSQQVFDEKTKRWREVDEKTIKKTRPSVVRYVSQESDGTITTTYKKKKFNRNTGKWTTVEEKVYKNLDANETIPEMMDDITNITTTTYQTKIFDSKTNTWKVVDEKSYTDTHTTVPRDIVEEIERDQADVANITTTTEITKIYDANTNSWKIVDKHSHTDFVEKIVDHPRETILIDDITDITNIRNERHFDETRTDISNIKDINNITNITNKKTFNQTDTDKNSTIVYDSINIDRKVFKDTTSVIDEKTDDQSRIKKTSGSDVVDRSITISKTKDNEIIDELNKNKTKTTKTLQTFTSAHQDQCICEICTCGRHRCTHDTTTTKITVSTDDKFSESVSAYKTDFDKKTTDLHQIRAEIKRPTDNLKPEGDFERPEKTKYEPAERPSQVKRPDNLRPEGDFFTPEKEKFQPAEKTVAVRPHDNLVVPSGDFDGKTTSMSEYTGETTERVTPIRRNTWTKIEGEMTTSTTSTSEYVNHSANLEKVTIKKATDNLKTVGETDFTTTNMTDYTESEVTYTEFKSTEKRKQVRHNDNLTTEGEMHIYKKNEVVNGTVEKTNIIRHEDNLKITGQFVDMVAKDDYSVTSGERAKAVRQEDNLKVEGKFTSARSSDDYRSVRAEKVVVVKTKDNLKLEGNFEDHTKRDDYTVIKGERVDVVRRPDNLKLEGEFDRPQQRKFEPSPRPKATKPVDNLRVTGDFEGKSSVQKSEFKNVKGERSEIVKHSDQITLNTGTMSKTTTNSDSFDKKTVVQPKQPRKNNMQSSISLGTDTNTMKTTNQMNYTSTRNVNKQNVVYETKEDRKDSNGLRDGTIAITTMKVTTVLANEKKQGPQPPEIIKTAKQTRVHEETNKTLLKSNVINKTNIINESNIVNQIDTVDTKSTHIQNDSKTSISSNVINRQSAINENSNIKNRSSNILNTDVSGQSMESKSMSSKNTSNQQSTINGNLSMKNRSSDILNTAANGHTLESSTSNISRSTNVINDGGTTITRTSKTESSSANIKNRSSDILNTENRSTSITTSSSSNMKNRSSDILNSGHSVDSSNQKRAMSTTSQADKITSQLNLRGNSSIENRSSSNNIIHSDSHHRSINNITNCAVHNSGQNATTSINKSTIHSEQRRDYVNSNASSVDQKQHHRKNTLTSREDVSNSVFHRKDGIVSTSNEAVHSNSLSTAAAIQRKSISNLHDQALYTSTNRKSYSTIHRNEKEIERSGQNWSHSHNITGGGDFYGKAESKSYGNFSGHNRNDRVVTKRSVNQSSIVLGDGSSSGTSMYKREYVKVHDGPCPAAHIDKGTFQHTRDTKTHTFYSRR